MREFFPWWLYHGKGHLKGSHGNGGRGNSSRGGFFTGGSFVVTSGARTHCHSLQTAACSPNCVTHTLDCLAQWGIHPDGHEGASNQGLPQLKWHDEKADNSPWINALAELRQRATREGLCFQHVQAITLAIDQDAEAATGNRDYFSTSPTASAK